MPAALAADHAADPPDTPVDSDELLEANYARLIAAGTHTAEDVAWLRRRQRCQEELEVCRFMIKSRTWEVDASCSRSLVYVCYATALAGLNRRRDAVAFLEQACDEQPDEAGWALTLAKMLFHENRKEESFARCAEVIAAFERGVASREDTADAYHLAGWVKIHADDHTAAYALWAAGHAAIPDDPTLRRQTLKRRCWDEVGGGDDAGRAGDGAGDGDECEPGLIGDGAHGDGAFDAAADLESWEAAPTVSFTPAYLDCLLSIHH